MPKCLLFSNGWILIVAKRLLWIGVFTNSDGWFRCRGLVVSGRIIVLVSSLWYFHLTCLQFYSFEVCGTRLLLSFPTAFCRVICFVASGAREVYHFRFLDFLCFSFFSSFQIRTSFVVVSNFLAIRTTCFRVNSGSEKVSSNALSSSSLSK